MVNKETLNDVLKSYLKSKEYSVEEINKVVSSLDTAIKDAKEEPKAKPRYGTSCFGIIDKNEKHVICEI